MPGTPPTSPRYGIARYSDADAAAFSAQVNAITDGFDAGTAGYLTGLASAIPAAVAANAGKIYYATDTGVYSVSTGAAWLQLGGAPVTFSTGDLKMSAAATAPAGWVLCDGGPYSRATYAALFSVLGTAYGAGDGVTTFNVPDLRQRFPLGKAASGTGNALGASGGAIDHTHTVPGGTPGSQSTTSVSAASADKNVLTSVGATPGTTSGTNNPPFQVVNYFIKT